MTSVVDSIKGQINSIIIVENRNFWLSNFLEPDKENDLVLCLDFGLHNQLKLEGFKVAYLDGLLERQTALNYNKQLNHYLQNWFRDDKGNSLLDYKGFDIGDALLLNVLNDITYFCHFFFNLNTLYHINYKKLFVACTDKIITDVLTILSIPYQVIEARDSAGKPVYNFPILKWTEEQINSKTWKSRIRKLGSAMLDVLFNMTDVFQRKNKLAVFVQNYNPTTAIINTLIADKKVRVILGDYIPQKNMMWQRRVVYKKLNSGKEADVLIDNYKKEKKADWIFEGYDLGSILQKRLLPTVEKNVDKAISVIKNINNYFAKHKIALMVPVSNLWLNNRLIMNYCRNNNIPVFMVINGLLNVHYWQDAHDSTWVNCYSESLKQDYFKNSDNALPIGDPRMDAYAGKPEKIINRDNPTILIGSAGYNHIDQTSYVAYEFDFLFDILKAIEKLHARSYKSTVILKVRANGYAHLYQSFVDEYYPNLAVSVIQDTPFNIVLNSADLYISFYSQTIIEAATLGIPTIYYKKDMARMYRPYDGESELVTAFNTTELENYIIKFYKADNVFDTFLDKEVIKKYIGNVDGDNLQRNMSFIYTLLNINQQEA